MKMEDPSLDILARYRQEAIEQEDTRLHTGAALSREHNRRNGRDDDHRLPYQRDVDRIVHSKSYVRYVDKTQVVYLVDNDHITHRSLHVQLVANFAKGIAEILRLNVPLVEAIALGHDVGHPPFGHEGEGYLSELAVEYGLDPFAHPWQSCRLLREIEPLNLGLAVYDGFLCHDGGMVGTVLEPRFGKSWEDHFADMEAKLTDPDQNIMPGTLEGCLVKMADTMSYLGRDIEDAISLGILSRDQVPETCLGRSNREILSCLARDVIDHSYGKNCIAMSDEVYEALKLLRQFNFETIYSHPKLKQESARVKRSYGILFQLLLDDLNREGEKGFVEKEFLSSRTEAYRKATAPERIIVDYIAGMTDSFFCHTIRRLVLPGKIDL
jgi:dGTPase